MKTHRIIIDTDPGFDDMVSILLAFASPELELLGICAVAGNVPLEDTARNALRVCELAGRTDVPVFMGCAGPLLRDQVFGKYANSGGLGGDLLPEPALRCAEGHAVDHIVKAARDAAARGETITICAHAPLTNVAMACLMGGEEFVRGVERIIIMGGAFEALGNRVPWAEFNVYADPHAAAVVFASKIPVTLFPLDATFQGLLTPERLDRIRAVSGRVGEVMEKLLKIYDRNDVARYGQEGGPLHDPMVPAFLLRPELFETVPAWVGVETANPESAGHTYCDFFGKLGRKPNCDVVRRVDSDGFFALVTERLAAYGPTQRGETQ
ncbi:nucleoside hydrolase [Desulfovibrio sp. OttesenSCG-928-I05]|nr:nucleoside hydrolase [Desulfovibrio sp. OttesenSCG-928-I05]